MAQDGFPEQELDSLLDGERTFSRAHVVGADGAIYDIHPLPEITTLGYRFGELVEPLSDRIPPGSIAKGFVYGSAVLAAALSLKRRDTVPLRALAQGHAFGALATNLLSLVAHRIAPHGAAKIEPHSDEQDTSEIRRPIFELLRFGTAVIGAVRPNRAVAMHRIHHRFTDTQLDPHSPRFHGRFPVFFGITGIMQQTERSYPELVAAEQTDYRSRKRWYDGMRFSASFIIATHMAIGKALGVPVGYRFFSAILQAGDAYMLNATFTADAHAAGEANDIDMGLLSPLFPEEYHKNHHDFPRDPRHSRVDPVYAFLRFLSRHGQAKITGSRHP